VNVNGPLVDAFGRVRGIVEGVVDGLTPAELAYRPDADANSIAWLVWHLTRIQDDHVADAAGTEQVWTARRWRERLALPFPADATGYGHTRDEVAAVRVESGALLTGYHAAVHEQTIGFLGGITTTDLDRIVDEGWDPPVSLGVRLVSVIADDLEHAGQAAYVRGLVERRRTA
jgi:DinB superfamily